MNETIRQKTATQSQRQVGSVPVLFSVRNVQPKIVGAISQPKPNDSSAREAVQPSSAIAMSAVAASPAIATSSVAATSTSNLPKTTAPSSSNNRSYNIAVGLLVIALCLLVIRNTQSSKPDTKDGLASNTVAIPAESKPLSNLKVELVPPSLPSPTAIKPFDLNMASAAGPKPVFSTISSTSDVVDASPPSQPLNQNALPMLLSSKESESMEETTDAKGSVENRTVAPPLSFPEPSVAVDAGASQTNGNSAQPINSWPANMAQPANNLTSAYRPEVGSSNGNSMTNLSHAEGKTSVVDSISPTLTSRELMEMKELHELIEMRKSAKNLAATGAVSGQSFAEPSVRATTVSNIAPVSNMPPASLSPEFSGGGPVGYKPLYRVDQGTRDPSVMTGRAYSTAPQEFPPLTVPSYEREAFASRQPPPTATQTQIPIRQPSTTDGNRYPASSQTPYAPLPPVQNGSSFGYPPGR